MLNLKKNLFLIYYDFFTQETRHTICIMLIKWKSRDLRRFYKTTFLQKQIQYIFKDGATFITQGTIYCSWLIYISRNKTRLQLYVFFLVSPNINFSMNYFNLILPFTDLTLALKMLCNESPSSISILSAITSASTLSKCGSSLPSIT